MSCAVRRQRRDWSWLAAIFAVALPAVGCNLPHDPVGTLDRVRGGVMRVGIDLNDPWTAWEGNEPQGRPVGIEPKLIEEFAREIGTEILWVRGSEAEVLTSLENFDLDLVAAGLKDDTLWSDRVALSRPYAETAEGKHVLAAAPGENAFLLRLDKFLRSRQAAVAARLAMQRTVSENATVD